MTADTATKPDQDITARRLAAFEKASKGVVEEDALPKGVNPDNFRPPAPEATQTEETEEPAKPKVDDEAKRRAVAALLRSGFDQAEIDAMPVERLLERGLKRHEILARDDDAHRRVRDLEASPKETRAKSLEPTAHKPESEGVPKIDFVAAVKPFAEQYGLDDGGNRAFAGAFEATVGPLAAELHALKSERQAEANQKLLEALTTAQSEMSGKYPALTDAATFAEVVGAMDALETQPRFQKIADPTERARSLMQAAAASLGLQQAEAPATTDPAPKTTRTVRVVKQETGTSPREEAPKELSRLDRRWAAFDHLTKKHGDVAGAKKAAGLD